MNDRDNRKIQYEPAIEWFTANAPEDWDPYDFSEEVVFDMETGDFSQAGVIYMLCQLGILRRASRTREADVHAYIDKYQSEEEKRAEEERKKREAEEAVAAEARRIQEEEIERQRQEAEAKRKADEDAYKARQVELKESLTDQDKEVVERIQEYGFSEESVIQAFLACEGDEELAVNLLLEGGFGGPAPAPAPEPAVYTSS